MSKCKAAVQRNTLLLLLCAWWLVASGCDTRLKQEASISTVPIPDELDISFIAWVDGWLVLALRPREGATAFSTRLWQMHPDGSDAQPLPLPEREGCHRQGFEAPTRLPDGRLGYIVRCFSSARSALSDLYMMAHDLRTGITEQLLRYPLPSSQVGTGGYVWNPAMTRGITSDGNGRGLDDQLYWFTPDQWQKLDVGLPQAFGPSWSPDGKAVAFLGAPEQGRSGVARIESLFNVYLMDVDGTGARPVSHGFRYVATTDWSPDGRWLALHGAVGSVPQERGLWLIEIATGQRRMVARGEFGVPRWSPDGTQMAVIRYQGEYPDRQQQLVIVDVHPLTG